MQIRWPLGGERIHLLWLVGGRRLFHRSEAALKLLNTLMRGIELLLYPLRAGLLCSRGYGDADACHDEKRSHFASSTALNHTRGVW